MTWPLMFIDENFMYTRNDTMYSGNDMKSSVVFCS